MAAPPLLFAPEGSRAFAALVGQAVGIALSPLEEREFEDGEHKARPLVNVRDRDVYVLHSLYGDPRQSANDKLCRLLFIIGALKDAAAARVTAVVPYLAYARKDRKTKARDPVTTRYVASLFEAVGTDVVVTIDVHNLAAFQNAFRCRTEHLEATGLFVEHFASRPQEREIVVVSPDAGGIKRMDQFRQRLSRRLGKPVAAAFCEKYRSSGVLSGEMLVGEVDGRDAIIIDDLISSGSTLARAAQACRARGAVGIFAAATHGLFVADAPAILAGSELQEIVVTDTVASFRLDDATATGKLRTLSCAGMFAQAIERLHGGGSIVELMDACCFSASRR
jgi:ribose-phosphate pyrophosphokinase